MLEAKPAAIDPSSPDAAPRSIKNLRWWIAGLLAVATLFLAACGGGGCLVPAWRVGEDGAAKGQTF